MNCTSLVHGNEDFLVIIQCWPPFFLHCLFQLPFGDRYSHFLQFEAFQCPAWSPLSCSRPLPHRLMGKSRRSCISGFKPSNRYLSGHCMQLQPADNNFIVPDAIAVKQRHSGCFWCTSVHPLQPRSLCSHGTLAVAKAVFERSGSVSLNCTLRHAES